MWLPGIERNRWDIRGAVIAQLKDLAQAYSDLEIGTTWENAVGFATAWEPYVGALMHPIFPIMVAQTQWVVCTNFLAACATAGMWRQIFISPYTSFWILSTDNTTILMIDFATRRKPG